MKFEDEDGIDRIFKRCEDALEADGGTALLQKHPSSQRQAIPKVNAAAAIQPPVNLPIPREELEAKRIEPMTEEPPPGYSPRVGEALAAVDGWTVQDFIDLALAAADQAGASIRDQERIAEILNARRAS